MKLTRRATGAALLAATVFVTPPLSSSGAPPVNEQSIQLTNAAFGLYERRYGDPIFMSVDTLLAERVRPVQSVRTFGRFGPSPLYSRHPEAAPGSTATPPPGKPQGTEASLNARDQDAGPKISFQLCGERTRACLTISPVPEIADSIEGHGPKYYGQRALIVGAFDAGTFLFWAFEAGPDPAKRGENARESALRALVAAAGAAEGSVVRARGKFRGRNLFGDLPEDTRRGSSDWVIADQGVAVWVSGKAPKGKGWSLDLDDKAESTRWLEVEGLPTARDGVVYLKAHSVALVKGPAPVAEAKP